MDVYNKYTHTHAHTHKKAVMFIYEKWKFCTNYYDHYIAVRPTMLYETYCCVVRYQYESKSSVAVMKMLRRMSENIRL